MGPIWPSSCLKGYMVHGIKRGHRRSIPDGSIISIRTRTSRTALLLHYGDMTDATNLIRLVQETQPDEIYNLAAQSHVQVWFETPEYTANADALGRCGCLRRSAFSGWSSRSRFYQASTSELYGKCSEVPQTRNDALYPRSPYAAAKLYAYWITVNYREAYGIHASNGILFNHEGPMRGETFVTRKITRAVAAIELGMQEQLFLGNLDAKRDWGHARDYVEGMWRILQQPKPDDYVLATGETASVREFVEKAFAQVGRRSSGGESAWTRRARCRRRAGAGRGRSALLPSDRGRSPGRRSHKAGKGSDGATRLRSTQSSAKWSRPTSRR